MIDVSRLLEIVPGGRLLPGNSQASSGGLPSITGLAYDSRQVRPGDLFFCLRGLKTDGHRFLPEAIARGAAAAVVECSGIAAEVPLLQVLAVREAMGRIAATFYGYPARRLSLVGVTGTNGKTTTTFLIAALARAAGWSSGVIGTIGAVINEELLPGDRTTPEAPDLQALLAQMAGAAGSPQAPGGACRPVVAAMEASSHALAQDRTLGCEFDVGVFTNLTQDHLDYHQDMEDYFRAKARLFTAYPLSSGKSFTGVINTDDPYGRRLAAECAGAVLTCGIEQPAALQAREITASPKGIAFEITAPEGVFPIRLRLGGRFNVYNSLAAMGAARALGIPWDTIVSGIAAAQGVPGRFQSVDAGQDFSVIVDYAHTPDGLENVLRAARDLKPTRLFAVFGCGGDRDRGKRPIMGRLAAEIADQVIITSDNPRSEDPEAIIREIAAGVPAGEAAKVETEPDRRKAIERAIRLARTGDLVVIAGKGHETYQIFANGALHFDDCAEARMALNARLSS